MKSVGEHRLRINYSEKNKVNSESATLLNFEPTLNWKKIPFEWYWSSKIGVTNKICLKKQQYFTQILPYCLMQLQTLMLSTKYHWNSIALKIKKVPLIKKENLSLLPLAFEHCLQIGMQQCLDDYQRLYSLRAKKLCNTRSRSSKGLINQAIVTIFRSGKWKTTDYHNIHSNKGDRSMQKPWSSSCLQVMIRLLMIYNSISYFAILQC